MSDGSDDQRIERMTNKVSELRSRAADLRLGLSDTDDPKIDLLLDIIDGLVDVIAGMAADAIRIDVPDSL